MMFCTMRGNLVSLNLNETIWVFVESLVVSLELVWSPIAQNWLSIHYALCELERGIRCLYNDFEVPCSRGENTCIFIKQNTF